MSVSIDSICSNYGVKKIDPAVIEEKKEQIIKLNDLNSFVLLLEQVEYTKARMSKRGGEISEKGVEVYVKHLKKAGGGENAIETMVSVFSEILTTELKLNEKDRKLFESMLYDANELMKFFEALELSQESRALYVQIEGSTPEKSLTFKVEKAVKQMVGLLAQGLPVAYKTWIGIDANWVDEMIEKESYSKAKTQLGSLFKTECQKIKFKEKKPEPQPEPKPLPAPKKEIFKVRLMLKPVYGLLLPQKEHSLGAQFAASGQFNISEKFKLQVDYAGDGLVPYDFSSAIEGRDSAAVSFLINPKNKKVNWVIRASFLRDVNYQLGTEDLLGGAGVGLSLLDGMLNPYAGGMFGTSSDDYGGGGYGGLDVNINSEHHINFAADFSTGWGLETALGYAYTWPKGAIGAQAFYANNFDGRQKVGGTVAGRIKLAHFLKHDLSLEPSVTAAGNLVKGEESAVDLTFGLALTFGRVQPARPLTSKPFLYDLPAGPVQPAKQNGGEEK